MQHWLVDSSAADSDTAVDTDEIVASAADLMYSQSHLKAALLGPQLQNFIFKKLH